MGTGRGPRARSGVLIDGRPLRAPLSGVGQYVRSLTRALLDLDEVRLGLLEFDFLARGRGFRENLGIDFSRLSSRPHRLLHRKIFNGLAAYSRFPIGATMGFGSYAVIHETYFERLGVSRARSSARQSQARVATIHDVGFLRRPQWFEPRNLAASRRAFASQVAQSDVILTPSQFTRAEVLKSSDFDPDRVLVTPLAPVADLGGRVAVRAAGKGRPYALYVGNIDPRKNLEDLVDGWKGARLGRNAELVLVGAPLRGYEGFAARLGNLRDQGIQYLGFVSDERRDQLLSGATCFVYPSDYEGFGLPVLEAMRAGVPVVTSDAPALVELVGSAACTVPRHDSRALGEALDGILSDERLRSRLADAGVERAAGFSWAGTARATLNGYRLASGA